MPPFRHQGPTPGEHAFTLEHGWFEEAWKEASGLGGALLRRLLIFRSGADWLDMAGFTKHVSTYGFRLTFAESHWTDHDTLIEHLTHPVCGLALKEDMRTCTCAFGERSCRIWFDGPEQAAGRLDLQLVTDQEDCEIAEYNQALTYAGSPHEEIMRATGRPSGAAVVCAPGCHGRHGKVAFLRRIRKDVERNTRREGGRPDDCGRVRPQGLSSAFDALSVAGHASELLHGNRGRFAPQHGTLWLWLLPLLLSTCVPNRSTRCSTGSSGLWTFVWSGGAWCKRRSVGARTDRGTWVRLERRPLARVDGQGWNGTEAAAALEGVAMLRWLAGVAWRDASGEAMWRADETTLLPGAPVKPGGTLTIDPQLPGAWWGQLNRSLDALAGQTTTRIATPDTVTITQARVTREITSTFGDLDTTLADWRPAHADLNWANVTGPTLGRHRRPARPRHWGGTTPASAGTTCRR